MRKTYDVCCAVVSDLEFDARVWKEVRSLSAAGYRVVLVGCCYERSGRRYASGESVDVVEVSLGSRNGKVSVLGRMQTLARIWMRSFVRVRTPTTATTSTSVRRCGSRAG